MDHVALKKSLRKELLSKRMQLRKEEVGVKSRMIFEKWRNRFSLKRASFFHVYQNMPEKNEVETNLFTDFVRLRHPQVHIIVPVIDKVNLVLRHALIGEEIVMEPNRWGILEPRLPVTFVYPLQLDMVIVPMLGFDEHGQRIGYGAGYYDRFLALVRPGCLKIGLCFEIGRLKEPMPSESHDVPLDFVITESGSFRFNPNLAI